MNSIVKELTSVNAVLKIEEEVELIIKIGGDRDKVREYIENIDTRDQIFGLSRAFYIMVMMVSEKLSDLEGFTPQDRRAHYLTLVNFTDFSQLRLIMICIQFMDYKSSMYLQASLEFKAVIEEIGLGYDLY